MRYELLIQKNGSYIPLDLGGDAPIMVLQVSQLTELKDIHTSYSQAISLPKSVANCEAFDYADDFQARSGFPYAVYPCALYCDGARLIPDGFRLVVKSVEDYTFRCQIVSNVNGLFTSLGDLPMSELGLPLIPYTLSEIQASVNGQRDYVFALSASHYRSGTGPTMYSFVDDPVPSIQQEPRRQRNEYGLTMVNSFWPYFRLRTLVEKIFAAQGYTLDAPAMEKDVYVSLADMKPTATSFDPLTVAKMTRTATIGASTEFPLTGMGRGIITSNYDELDSTNLYDPDADGVRTSGACYTATDHINVKVRLHTTSTGAFRVRYRVRKYGFVVSETNPTLSFTLTQENLHEWENRGTWVADLAKNDLQLLPDGIWESDSIELSPGEKIYIEANITEGVVGDNLVTTLQFSFDPENNKVPAGGIIDPGVNFDFANQLDCVKLFTQLHALLVQVDSDKKVVTMRPLNDVIEAAKANRYVDWTNKLDVSRKQEVAFTLDGYAQRNNVQYKTNDKLGVQDVASVDVVNANIATDRVMLELPPLSSYDREIGMPLVGQDHIKQYVGVRPHYTIDKWENVVYLAHATSDGTTPIWPQTSVAVGATLWNNCPLWKYNAAGMYVCEIVPMLIGLEAPRVGYLPYNMQLPATAKRLLPNAKIAKHLPVSHFVDNYYNGLQDNVLDKVRVLTAYFYLTPDDVSDIDYLTPVYIENYGQYFLIQKIDNYRADTVTKVTLVAINL